MSQVLVERAAGLVGLVIPVMIVALALQGGYNGGDSDARGRVMRMEG